ncbi:S-layer homology domain-containing protein, partial [Patescibacteria group bacterium]|nr:S-layer homology domain-containing protein [Patescibacteria group bacterium]
NHHVIYDDNEQAPLDTFEVCITFNVQNEPICEYTARLIDHDEDLDIALLQLNDKDVFNKTISNLAYLNYQTDSEPVEETNVTVKGYPGSGGDTITITKGQISGHDTYNGYSYFKTDTDFDHGSSGGTVLDENGNFIGIPTYIRSYAENVGYFLDLREALGWISKSKNGKPIYNQEAESRLKLEMARLERANNNLEFEYAEYPEFSVELPNGWKFLSIEDDGFFAEQDGLSDPVGLGVYFNRYQYTIDDAYLDKVDEELAKVKEKYPDYNQEDITFNGKDAIQITYTYFNLKEYTIYIPYGYTLISLSYAINLDDEEEQDGIIQEVLDSIKINSGKVLEPDLDSTISFDEPDFSITMPNDWRIQKNNSNSPMNLLAEAVQRNNFDGYIYIYYTLTPKDERGLSSTDRLKEETDYIGGSSKLIFKKDDVVLDGLEGWLYAYEYEGDKYQEMHKQLTIKLQDGDYEFSIYYDDLSNAFDRNLSDLEEILNSFTFNSEDNHRKGEYDFGSLSYSFSDIQYHRFSSAISDMADKGIIKGYDDGTFKPEKLINRSEALKVILESKNYLESEKGLGKEIDFAKHRTSVNVFNDLKKEDWYYDYVKYAYENEVVSGYSDGNFKPGQTVTLVEALKMIFGVYEVSLWEGETDPWYKLYMDKGYELYLIPNGMDDPGRELTRAELTYIVSDIYNQASNTSGFYY